MEHVQRVSAECQRYLRDMGIDRLVWIHAMETPAEELFTFKPDELLTLKLATPLAPRDGVGRPAGEGLTPGRASAPTWLGRLFPDCIAIFAAFRRIPPLPADVRWSGREGLC